MNKRGAGRKAAALAEMFLMISLSFAIAFFFQENLVKSQIPFHPPTSSLIPGGVNSAEIPSGFIESTQAYTLDGKVIPSGDSLVGAGGKQIFYQGKYYSVGSNSALTALETTTPQVGAIGPAQGVGGLLSGNAFGSGAGVGGFASSLTSGLIWGAALYGILYFGGTLFGLNQRQAQSLGLAGGAGGFVGSTAYFLASNGFLGQSLAANAGLFGLGLGLGVGVAVFLATYKKEKKEIVQFICEPWQPPVGGNRCDECNKDLQKPCSEYRCKSLGQACNIVNKGTSDQLCVWTNKNDVTAPIISPWDEALKPTGLRSVKEGNGYRVVDPKDPKGCLQPFSRLEFGVQTNEPSQCRLDIDANNTRYDQMNYLFGSNALFDYTHAQTNFRVPNPNQQGESGEAPVIHNNGAYTFYVRCIDANGNGQDAQPFAVRFCVGEGPDTTPPVIEGFSISDGSPVRYQVDKVPIEVYTNEPSDCRWSRRDQTYETMENSMSCASSTYQINSQLNYVCSGDLTGVQDRQNNEFYFRCKDQPLGQEQSRNVMTSSRKLTLKGTEPLVITSVGPTGTLSGSTSVLVVNLTVKTAFGENDGAATCFYENSPTGQFNIAMLGSGSAVNYQPIDLPSGNYNYYFKCIDAGGNLAENYTSFSVSVDSKPPVVIRAYKDGPNLKIITNEEAKCVYSLDRCDYDFASGIVMRNEDASVGKRKTHVVEWGTDKTYYIKCEDYQGVRVAPNQCSIVVQGSEL